MQLLNNYVLIKPLNKKAEMNNGIHVAQPVSNKKDIVCGVVVNYDEKIKMQIADKTVYYPLYAADTLTVDEVSMHLIHMEDIMVVL